MKRNRLQLASQYRLFAPVLKAALLLAFCCGPWAIAYDTPMDDGHHRRCDPNDQPSPGEPPDEPADSCNACNSPVFMKDGSLALEFPELALGGRFPLILSHTYNSKDDRHGLLGRGWTHTLEMRAIPYTDGLNQGVLVRWHTGQRHDFVLQPDGSLSSPPGSIISLTSIVGGYRIGFADQYFFETDSDGRVVRQLDANGNAIDYQYDSQDCIVSLTTPDGDVLLTRDPNGRIASITGSGQRVVQFTYDRSGNLISYTDPVGNALQYFYDMTDRLIEVRGPSGQTTHTVQYDSSGRVSRLVDWEGDWSYSYSSSQTVKTNNETGAQKTYQYDDQGVIHTIVDEGSFTIISTYDSMYNLTSRTDENGDTTSWTYDAQGRVLIQTEPGGLLTTYAYDGNGRLALITKPDGVSEAFEYDDHGNLIANREAVGTGVERELLSTYDDRGNKTSFTDGEGNTWTFSYDSSGRPIEQTDPTGVTTYFTYDLSGNLISSLNERGEGTYYEYNANGQLVKETNPVGAVHEWIYENGSLVTEIEPNGGQVSYTRDAYGRIITRIDPVGATIQYTYSQAGLELSKIDALGNTWTYEHDLKGRRTKEIDPLGGQARWTYDGSGNVLSQINPLGHATTYSYDPWDRKVRQTDAKGNTETWEYNAVGGLIRQTAPDAGTKEWDLDELGRAVALRDELGYQTVFEYDLADRLTRKIEPGGGAYAYTYDPLGRLLSKVDPLGGVTQYQHDDHGIIGIVDPNGADTSLQLDAAGRILQVTDPLGNSNGFEYDAANRLVTWTNARTQAISYEYDLAGQLVRVTLPNGEERSFTYDASGNRLTATGAETQRRYTYDALGRTTRITDALAGNTLDYSYDAAGNRITRAVGGLPVTSYGYDTTEELRQMSVGAEVYDFQRDPVDRISLISRPTGLRTHLQYDLRGALSQVLQEGQAAEILRQLDYGIDALGRYIGVSDSSGDTTQFSYDALSRLVAETRVGSIDLDQGFAYDPAGNRISRIRGGVTTTYQYDDARRLISEVTGGGTVNYQYDADGNQTLRQSPRETLYYAYDAESFLIAVTSLESDRQFGYDVDGDLWRIVEDGVEARALLEDGQMLLQTSIFSGPRHAWIRADGQLLAGISGSVQFQHLRGLADTLTDVVDSSGMVVDSFVYDAFGQHLSGGTTVFDPFGFGGQYHDPAVELSFYSDGAYDPRSGRYVHLNARESYAHSRPYAFRDSNPVGLYFSQPRGLVASVAVNTHSTDNEVNCDGAGGFKVHIGTKYPYNGDTCTEKHEQQHVRDFKADCPNGCKDKKPDAYPTCPNGEELKKKTECNAYKVGKNCNTANKKKCCTDFPKEVAKCEKLANDLIKRDEDGIKKYCK